MDHALECGAIAKLVVDERRLKCATAFEHVARKPKERALEAATGARTREVAEALCSGIDASGGRDGQRVSVGPPMKNEPSLFEEVD